MHTRTLGPFQVSALGLGCMSFSMGYGPADDTESARVLQAALDAGYSFLDTASMYGSGHNESLIGATLKPRRSEYVLASKCGLSKDETGKPVINGRPEVLKKQCEASLRRLQTETIDLYYLHRLDPNIPIEESVGGLADLIRAGKIRTLGLCEISTASLRRAHQEHPVTAVQSEYSLWSRTPETSLLAACAELAVTFVPFSPLGRGFFTGKAQDVTQLTQDDVRCTNARPRFEPEAFTANSKLLQPFAELAKQQGCTMAQLALAWLLAQKQAKGEPTLIPIPGTKHLSYLLENAGAGDIQLSAALVQTLNELINESTIQGQRYTAALMASIDAEQDRLAPAD